MKHISITYARGCSFDYQITDTALPVFTEEFKGWAPDAQLTVDDYVTDELPVMPCAQLWEP